MNDDLVRNVSDRLRDDNLTAQELLPLVYDELRRLARTRIESDGPDLTLQPTALVHEAWLRLSKRESNLWACKAHFFRAAALAMRDIMIDRHRRKGRVKHGGDTKIEHTDADLVISDEPVSFLALDSALERLKALDEVKHQVVMLRYFTGLTADEVANVLGFSRAWVQRQWRFARAWLQREIEATETDGR